jgi:hypothetical protein
MSDAIFEYKLTRESLLNDFSYMNEDSPDPEFTEKELADLTTELQDAVYGVIENFMNHR